MKQQPRDLLLKYKELFKQSHDQEPTVNFHKHFWGAQDVIDSVGFAQAMRLLEFYFKTNSSHSITWFFYNFEKLEESLKESELQEKQADKVQKKTLERLLEWKTFESRN